MANITHIEIDGHQVVEVAAADELSAAIDRGERRIACSRELAEEFGIPMDEELFEGDDPDDDQWPEEVA